MAQDVSVVSYPEIDVLVAVNVNDFASVSTTYIEGVRLEKANKI